MSEVIEEKWPKGLVTSLAFFFILVLMLATVVPNALIDRVLTLERQWGYDLLTQEDMSQVIRRTGSLYTTLVIDSGAKAAVSDLLMPRGERLVESFEAKVDGWFEYLASRGAALQKILYQMVYRVVMMLFWLPFLAVVLLPAVFAGWMRWHAKRHSFDYASPLLNNNAVAILSWGAILLLLSVLLPVPIPPLLVCTFILILVPVVLSLLISNLPKRI
ncbi:DUF4400 domain-containing protein [Azotobacter armeniacus]